MKPRQFEELVFEHFKNQGYEATLIGQSGDYGVDVFATKGKEKIAVQAKMFGGSTRKINRKTMMELYGAKTYFDCSKAVIVTNGDVLKDALEVAFKLDIEIVYLDNDFAIDKSENNSEEGNIDFALIWENYIKPLKGQTLTSGKGKTNIIKEVDGSGVKRITSNKKPGSINIEIFKEAVNILLADGSITREYINQNYTGRASSGVILILSQVPFFKLTDKPIGLKYVTE